MSAENWKVKLWCAVHDYAKSCGGTPDLLVYGNTERQNAVTALESAILDGERETKLKLAASEARVKELEVMRHAALELAQYASYAEIVGRVSLNKDQIREWSDKIFKLNLDLGDAMPRKDTTPSTDNK